ncbi:MAG: hypothetical protein AB1411_13555 [Nitrospirota bacterium]
MRRVNGPTPSQAATESDRAEERRLKLRTRQTIARLFDRLDYRRLGPIYCEEGGGAFWKASRGPCERLGVRLALVLLNRLKPGGRSLYVGAGVAELPMLLTETLELGRTVEAYNLRADEVTLLNRACRGLPVRFEARDGRAAGGRFDHLWLVSVFNDPERFPELSALSYGRANPATFDPVAFARERKAVLSLAEACLDKLTLPGLVTTSVEEIPWIVGWCAKRAVPCVVEEEDYPTAIVGDPVCFIRLGTRT